MRSCVHVGLASSKFRSLLVAFAALMMAQCVWAADVKDAVEKTRLEKMLADGDTGMIVQVFKRHPGRTLPFIDRYLESGLAMIEKGEEPAKALASFRTGIRFAALADEAFGGTTFSDYANSFASWSPTEQKNFRAGQREFRAGTEEADAGEALKHFRRSLALAAPLGDTWGQAMAWQGIAEKLLELDHREDALKAAMTAAGLNMSVRLQSDAAESFRLAAKASDTLNAHRRDGISLLAQAWSIVEKDASIDAEQREQILKDYIAALKEAGATEQIERLEREELERAEISAMDSEPAAAPAE